MELSESCLFVALVVFSSFLSIILRMWSFLERENEEAWNQMAWTNLLSDQCWLIIDDFEYTTKLR